MELTKTRSNSLFVAKAFAILSVICAHMGFTSEYFIADTIRNCLGQIGVVIFFVLSGFFYKRTDGDTKKYWSKKFKTVFIPWILFAIGTFILSVVLNRSLEGFPLSFIKYFLGIGSLYWYMSISIVMFAIFKYITKRWQLILCIIVSIVSVYLTAYHIIPVHPYFNQYINPFNWIGFFALGVLLKREDLLEKLINTKALIISLVGVAVSIAVAVLRGNEVKSYVDVTSLFTEVFGFVLILNLSNCLANNKLLIDIGKKSFFIYLMHIQIAGIITTRLPYNAVFFILRPFIALAVCYIVSVVFKYLLKLLKLDKYNFMFGLDR